MKQKTALIFDDIPESLSLMKDLVEMVDYKVIDFADPTIFLAQRPESCCHAKTDPCVDLILTDNQMPGMTGLEFLQMIKKNGCKLPDSKKGIISGTWSEEEMSLAIELGCKIFQKPVLMDELHEWITSCSRLKDGGK